MWKALEKWLLCKLHTPVQLTDVQIVFNDYEDQQKAAINMMILIIKQYIYAPRCKNHNIFFLRPLTRIVEFRKTDGLVAHKNNKM